jgi:hypothetical protein
MAMPRVLLRVPEIKVFDSVINLRLCGFCCKVLPPEGFREATLFPYICPKPFYYAE